MGTDFVLAGQDARRRYERIPGIGSVLYASDYGALGGATLVRRSSITSGTNTLTVTGTTLPTSIVGKTIIVDRAGTGSAPLVTTVTARPTTTTATLSANAGATATNVQSCYGNDETTQLQAFITACYTASATFGRVRGQLDNTVYIAAGAPTVGAHGENSILPLPYSTTQLGFVELAGARASDIIVWPPTGGAPLGTTIVSGKSTTTYDNTKGVPSIIGGPAAGVSRTASYGQLFLRDITFMQGAIPQLTCVDASWLWSFGYERLLCKTFDIDEDFSGILPVPNNPPAVGIIFPVINSNTPSNQKDGAVFGYYYGATMSEIANCNTFVAGWCIVGIGTLRAYHANWIGRYLDVNNKYGIAGADFGSGIVAPSKVGDWDHTTTQFASPFCIGLWDVQQAAAGTGFERVDDLYDPNNVVPVNARIAVVGSGVGSLRQAFTKTGGALSSVTDLYSAEAGTMTSFEVTAFRKAVSNVNFASFTVPSATPFLMFGAYRKTANTNQNNEVVFDLGQRLLGGTYTLAMTHMVGTDRGIYGIQGSIDGTNWTALTTIDGYFASTTSSRDEATGVTVPDGTRWLRMIMATKNASSSAYNGTFSSINGQRTGA